MLSSDSSVFSPMIGWKLVFDILVTCEIFCGQLFLQQFTELLYPFRPLFGEVIRFPGTPRFG